MRNIFFRFLRSFRRKLKLQLFRFHVRRLGAIDLWNRLIPSITLIDIGASYYAPSNWKIPLSAPNVTLISIDPNAENLSYLKNSIFKAKKVVTPCAVSGTGGIRKLYRTNVDSGSSFFTPRELKPIESKIFKEIQSYLFPIQEIEIETVTLESILLKENVKNPIFLKLDIQGAEMEVLRSIESYLKSGQVIAIETEASLMSEPLMKNGTNFAEISDYITKFNFELVNLVPIFSPINTDGDLNFGKGFLNECDAYFVKSNAALADLELNQKYALFVAYVMYGFPNHALAFAESDDELLSSIEKNFGYKKILTFFKLRNKYDQNGSE